MTFTYRGRTLNYCRAPYNNAGLNERAVEVPIASDFVVRQWNDEGLEVGNVLSHYGPTSWRTVDRYEGPERVDVFDIDGVWPWIVAVSTLEHVRWDPPEPREDDGAIRALDHLLSLLSSPGALLVTVPFGQHPHLDRAILEHRWTPEHECSMVRDGDDTEWTEAEVQHRPCHERLRWARSVWVAEFAA